MEKNQTTPTSPPEVDARFQMVLTLIALLKDARHKIKKSELEFMMVNQTYNLVPYRHCVYWQWDGDTVSILTASGLVQIDQNGPYALWLRRVIRKFLEQKVLPHKPTEENSESRGFASLWPVGPADCSDSDAGEWKKWTSAQVLLVAMKDHHGKVAKGLWIDREEPFDDLRKAVLEDLADGYAFILHQFEAGRGSEGKKAFWTFFFNLSRSKIKIALLVVIAAMFIPVRMSVNAPAEIVPREPYVVSIPFDGIIDSVEVLPGQAVKKGDLLVRMESTMLRNKSEVAGQEMETAKAALSKTEREALADRSKLADLAILKSQVDQRGEEKKFADELLTKAEIKAERDGVVMFPDVNSLRGRPAQAGEQIMLLADPQDSELLIRIPVASMIQIDESIPASFFLNVMPLGFKNAGYESIGYQATQDSDGLMTYKVRAKLDDAGPNLRVGWTGTGKVYGARTILAFNILRRPLVTVRRKLGI